MNVEELTALDLVVIDNTWRFCLNFACGKEASVVSIGKRGN